MTDTRRRVKLYALNAERQWDDEGTGHVSSTYVERLKGISLLVRAESDGKSPKLVHHISQQTLQTRDLGTSLIFVQLRPNKITKIGHLQSPKNFCPTLFITKSRSSTNIRRMKNELSDQKQ